MSNPNEARSYETYIAAPPERVWAALTEPDQTEQYFFGTRAESQWESGSQVRYLNREGGVDVEGEIVESEAPRRLVTTFKPVWSPEVAGIPASTVSWELEPATGATKLVLRHEGFDFAGPGGEQFHEGWVQTLSGLKTLVETGRPLALR
jgi:uncharacterized protein YndB with AHSA1/START domain